MGFPVKAVAKWESGETIPDIVNCDSLAQLYHVNLDELLHYNQEQTGLGIPPKGKHIFGTVRVGERARLYFPNKPGRCLRSSPVTG